MVVAVLLPTRLIVLGADGLLFAVAKRLDADDSRVIRLVWTQTENRLKGGARSFDE